MIMGRTWPCPGVQRRDDGKTSVRPTRRAIPIAILVVLLGIVIWTIRPSPFAEWMRAEGIANERPLEVVSELDPRPACTADPDRFLLRCSRVPKFAALIGLIVALVVLTRRFGLGDKLDGSKRFSPHRRCRYEMLEVQSAEWASGWQWC